MRSLKPVWFWAARAFSYYGLYGKLSAAGAVANPRLLSHSELCGHIRKSPGNRHRRHCRARLPCQRAGQSLFNPHAAGRNRNQRGWTEPGTIYAEQAEYEKARAGIKVSSRPCFVYMVAIYFSSRHFCQPRSRPPWCSWRVSRQRKGYTACGVPGAGDDGCGRHNCRRFLPRRFFIAVYPARMAA